LLVWRADLEVEEMRGNVGTRLRKLAERNDLDAIVVAAAGLKRLGLCDSSWTWFAVEEMIPAVGQGIIAVEARIDDAEVLGLLAAINDPDTMACAVAERAFLHAAGGGCRMPYAAHARVCGDELELIAARFAKDGSRSERTCVRGPKRRAKEIGEEAAQRINR
ncbi:MAG: hydroxymethylbilane synthase, partial [Verrucomicrobiae bacterium]|nr:hydroxymethylbilane synthase [Verrucomicrobiae bacterium]